MSFACLLCSAPAAPGCFLRMRKVLTVLDKGLFMESAEGTATTEAKKAGLVIDS